jgi:Mrp family chromosome partitioning ATPase
LAALAERVSRVETLADVTQPAKVVRPAKLPRGRVAPRPTRNTIVGGLIGLALGILAAFARDALDARLRGSRSIQEQLGLPLLGHVGEEPLKAAATPMNGRPAISETDLEPFHILRANLRFMDPERATRTIAVTSALPEEGKSSVAMLLACAHAVAGSRALLVECDFRRPALASRLGLEDTPGLADFLRDAAGWQEILREVSLGRSGSVNGDRRGGTSGGGSFTLIPAGRPAAHPAQLLGSASFADRLSVMSRAYDVVLLDCTPVLPVVDALEVLPHVEGTLLCVRDSSTTGAQARSAKLAIERASGGAVGIVVTGPRDEEDYGYYAPEEGRGAVTVG